MTETANRNTGGSPWRFRRRLAVGTLTFCAASAIYAMSQGPEMVAATLPTLGATAGIVLAAYFTAAVAEDRGMQP